MHYDEIPVHLHGFHCPRSTFVVPREKSGSNCGKFQVGYKHYWEIKYYLCHIIIIYTINFIYNSMNTDTDWEGAREALHTWQRPEQELWKSNIFYNQPRKAKHGISSQHHQYHQYLYDQCHHCAWASSSNGGLLVWVKLTAASRLVSLLGSEAFLPLCFVLLTNRKV